MVTKQIDKKCPVLVTGATGYVAGCLVEELLKLGLTVNAAVRDKKSESKLKYLNELAKVLPGKINYFQADLLHDTSYDDAIAGCELVFHTASPFSFKVEDPQFDLLDPAILGTRNVLASANKEKSVKRIVLTSSVAAMIGDQKDSLDMPNREITEEFWNTTSSLLHRPYSFSKVMAEKEAWRLSKQQSKWDLVTINPTFVMGPGINPFGTSESFDIFNGFLNGDYKIGVPDLKMACVDVRDVARAHVKAGFIPSASGRYIISGHNSAFMRIGEILKKLDPSLVIGEKILPKWFMWLIAPKINSTRKEIATSIGYPFNAVNLKSINDLNMEYLPLEKTISDWLCQLKES